MNELAQFKDVSILVVGDVMLDRYWWGSVSRISPEAPVPVVRHERTTLAPGGAANVAANIAALGGKPFLLGCAGKDEALAELSTVLQDSSVDPSLLIAFPDRCTTVKTRLIAHSQQVARIDMEHPNRLSDKESATVRESIDSLIGKADAVIVSDYAKGMLTQEVLARLMGLAAENNIQVFVDPKGKDFSKYDGAAFVTPNRREALEACKIDEYESHAVDRAGEELLTHYGFRGALITEGEHGMTLYERNREPVHIDAVGQEVFDVTGAGDTVIACFAMAIASGIETAHAARLANVAAGLSVRHVGAAVIRREELEQALRTAAETSLSNHDPASTGSNGSTTPRLGGSDRRAEGV